MENIESTQFVVLTGHLDDQPLPHLIRRLRVQRKSGRLQVEYPEAPGSFFFKDGQLVDAQLGALRGVEALYAALSLDGASFNFNPLIRPPERNIDSQEQQFIWDLIEAPRREALAEIKVAGRELSATAEAYALVPDEPRQLAPAPAELIAPLEERLTAVEAAVISTSRRFSRERLIYAVVISFLIGLVSILTLNVVFGPLFGEAASPAKAALSNAKPDASNGRAASEGGQSSPVKKESDGAAASVAREGVAVSQALDAKPKAKPAQEQSQSTGTATPASREARKTGGDSSKRGAVVVQVLVEVKKGRVTGARVWNSRAGATAYEALALKMAKQRRYPEDFTGGDRLSIRVKP